MTPTTRPDPEQTRAQTRRRQILDAAAICFAREGFHGTSIAALSKAAGMSPGHIYHFFENKEAIIEALVERKLEQSLEMVSQFENAEDVFQALIDRVDIGLNEKTDLDNAALELEILAEAARNPRVAASVRAADRIKHERLMGLLRSVRRARGLTHDSDAAAVTEILMALFDGLAARAINHPDLDREALIPLIRIALRTFIEGQ
ncbi:TetR/AcrR family transcriptional regulator [Allochromatium vinosum]|uniref:Transcriptional regulator, TetR family n=1 Tax=Allochromatium vinosum (strain ATCC 17899 / DSM 180 / NBRC 103801 / NCIMB 10441 / D) TaxID=572477 RepID=D3RQP8_ALLVD|nr:TetR/AcrR family transcriptional regulator [Allochromatium vinosum]ADC63732.1 transcriptional regulator, TetR family [Allochromatium vinosum DSM 180]